MTQLGYLAAVLVAGTLLSNSCMNKSNGPQKDMAPAEIPCATEGECAPVNEPTSLNSEPVASPTPTPVLHGQVEVPCVDGNCPPVEGNVKKTDD